MLSWYVEAFSSYGTVNFSRLSHTSDALTKSYLSVLYYSEYVFITISTFFYQNKAFHMKKHIVPTMIFDISTVQ